MDMADNERSVIDQYLGSTGPFPGYSLARSTNRCMKEIEFIDELPMTTTGKVQRAVLRERERARAAGGG